MTRFSHSCVRLACALSPLSAWLVAASLASASPGEAVPERKVQAVFLLNFARFVQWPPQAFPAPDTPLCIGVLGDDPFGALLDSAVAGETIHGRSVVVRRGDTAASLLNCHIVFMSASQSAQQVQDVAALASRPILTVGDLPGFTQRGGAVLLYRENGRERFEISRSAVERVGLKFSPQLLRLARIVAALWRGEES